MGKFHIGETCETCGTKVMKIMWGMPTEAGAREAERKGWYIGGCCIDQRVSRCECGATAYDGDGRPVGGDVDRYGDPYGDLAPIDDVDAARSTQSHPSAGRSEPRASR